MMMSKAITNQVKESGPQFIAAHFFSIPSQGNVYSLTPLVDAKGHARLLVASLQRKVYCLEYTNGRPCMREVPFTYIPAGAEIISIDAINRSVIQEDFIIGITIIKKDDGRGQQSQFFNIYSDWDLNSDSALDFVSQNCLPLHLDFVPYHLYHTQARSKYDGETVWLLSGSDRCIHLYRSDEESYQESSCSELFPEFKNLSEITLRMDVSYSSDSKIRTSAVCGEGGTVKVFQVNVESRPQMTASHTLSWDYPVASIKIFDLNTMLPLPKILQVYRIKEVIPKEIESSPAHVVVANTLESCYVYRDFPGTCEGYELPDSDGNDVISCCITCDIDQDGENEIIIGTYEQSVIMYKQRANEPESWDIYHRIKVPCPVLALESCDVIGDGSLQLIVMTTTGTHIFQDVFRDTPGRTTVACHDVDVGEARPVKQAPYRVNPQRAATIRKELDCMLQQGLIQPAQSEWCSPVTIVPKPGGSYQFCIDYRRVNSLTKADLYSLPRIEECIDQVGFAKFVSKFDLLKGYWQVPLSEKAKEISCFATLGQTFKCTVMPYGMKNCPAIFQRMMNSLTADIPGCATYIDDVVIYSDTWQEHLERV